MFVDCKIDEWREKLTKQLAEDMARDRADRQRALGYEPVGRTFPSSHSSSLNTGDSRPQGSQDPTTGMSEIVEAMTQLACLLDKHGHVTMANVIRNLRALLPSS